MPDARPARTPQEIEAIAEIERDERRERLITILLMSGLALALQAMHAPEALVGGAVGAAAVLVKSNASRGATLLASGAGAVLGAVLGGWLPVLS